MKEKEEADPARSRWGHLLRKIGLGRLKHRLLGREKIFSREETEKRVLETIGDAVGSKEIDFEEDEKEMIHSIFELGETTVKEIMIPRVDMVCVEVNSKLEQLRGLAKEKGHSRLPVYREDIDNILGIATVKDLLFVDDFSEARLEALIRPTFFIPESKKIDELLRDMRKKKMHMAIVLDEYGGTSGLVTLEDILEEIVGEIEDESDKQPPLIRKLDEHSYRVDATLSIKDLNEAIGSQLPEEEFETVGGLIYDLAGSLPEEGYKVEHQGLKFIVEEVVGQRIETVRVVFLEVAAGSEDETSPEANS
ncbi:MAG: hemolysin family protein [Candidatus Zixiibacteriota bacterium]